MAAAGVAARRVCEQMIEDGRVQVNGKTVRGLPVFVRPGEDRISVDGRPLPHRRPRPVYLMINKPARVLTTLADEPGVGRTTVLDLIDHPDKGRLFPVGRLDYETMGLVLLTSDGTLANRLTHPRYGVAKTYRAEVKGVLDVMAAQRIQKGLVKELRRGDRVSGRVVPSRPAGTEEGTGAGTGGPDAPCSPASRVQLDIAGYEEDRTILAITLREGRAGNIGKMLAVVGCPVKKLERTAIGPLELTAVARGKWRELTRPEVHALKAAGREAEAKAAGPRRPRPAQESRS